MYIICESHYDQNYLIPKCITYSKDKTYEYIYNRCCELLSGWCTCDKEYLFNCLDRNNNIIISDLARKCYCAYPYSEGLVIIDTNMLETYEGKN